VASEGKPNKARRGKRESIKEAGTVQGGVQGGTLFETVTINWREGAKRGGARKTPRKNTLVTYNRSGEKGSQSEIRNPVWATGLQLKSQTAGSCPWSKARRRGDGKDRSK